MKLEKKRSQTFQIGLHLQSDTKISDISHIDPAFITRSESIKGKRRSPRAEPADYFTKYILTKEFEDIQEFYECIRDFLANKEFVDDVKEKCVSQGARLSISLLVRNPHHLDGLQINKDICNLFHVFNVNIEVYIYSHE